MVVERWKFPADRLYATIYNPAEGDPASRDEEAWNFWAEKFRAAGLDPDLLRISVGLEPVEDIWAAFEHALAK